MKKVLSGIAVVANAVPGESVSRVQDTTNGEKGSGKVQLASRNWKKANIGPWTASIATTGQRTRLSCAPSNFNMSLESQGCSIIRGTFDPKGFCDLW